MKNYAEFYSDRIQTVGTAAAERLASMCRYIDKTGGNDEEGADRYQMSFGELTALREFFESAGVNAICLAFDYGRAKGYRAAQSAARREARA